MSLPPARDDIFDPPHLPLTLTPHSANRLSFEYRVLPFLAAAFAGLGLMSGPAGDPATLKPEAHIFQYAMLALGAAGGLTAAWTHAVHYLTGQKATALEMTEDSLIIRELHKTRGEISRKVISPRGYEAAVRTPINNEPFRVVLRPWGRFENEIVLETPLTYREAAQVALMLNHAIAYGSAPYHQRAVLRAQAEQDLEALLAQPQSTGLASPIP